MDQQRATRLNRREFIGAAAATGLALGAAPAITQARRPNLLVICTDQQHGRAMGAMDPFFETPHTDRLAREGARFERAWCTTPQCSPSRASIYTGLYPHRTGVIGNLNSLGHRGNPIEPLPTSFETIGSRLRRAGYHTAYTGKWHLGHHEHFAGHFDRAALDGDAHDGATADALDYLAERSESREPFACFVNYINPHDIYEYGFFEKPDDVPEPEGHVPMPASWDDGYGDRPRVHREYMESDQGAYFRGKPRRFWEHYRQVYREKCRLVDGQTGTLLAGLDRLGLAANTVVVFLSDHGDADTAHGLVYKGPFMYDELLRVPLIVRVPEAFGGRPGTTCAEAVVLTDLLPTLCDFAGADPGEPDGYSLKPWLTGAGPVRKRDYVVSQYYNKQAWVNPIRTISDGRFKYSRYVGSMDELYDLRNDPLERRNLMADGGSAGARDRLRSALDGWMLAHGDTAFEDYLATNRDGEPRDRV
jgi:arylsulfatase A-like enzyme